MQSPIGYSLLNESHSLGITMMSKLPTISIGSKTISRLIIGGNPFSGNSHQCPERDREMMDWYTTARIKKDLSEAEACGINTFLGRGDNHIRRMLHEYWQEGGTIQWIAQTCPERASLHGNIDSIADSGAILCYLHGGMADRLAAEGKKQQLADAIQHIKDRGLVAGIAAHDPETHRIARDELDVQFHAVCCYNLSAHPDTFPEEDRSQAFGLIHELHAPVLLYKFMAAGRYDPMRAFDEACGAVRDSDALVIGVCTKDNPNMIRENMEHVIRCFAPES